MAIRLTGADWCEPSLVDSKGRVTKLKELKWSSAKGGWGQTKFGENCGGNGLSIQKTQFSDGIGTHANSVIHFELPAGHDYVQFKAIVGLDDGGVNQGGKQSRASVRFSVLVSEPPADYFDKLESVLEMGR